eukprot:scaffold233665_cov23-Tisochrysis_lutea.AAC.2
MLHPQCAAWSRARQRAASTAAADSAAADLPPPELPSEPMLRPSLSAPLQSKLRFKLAPSGEKSNKSVRTSTERRPSVFFSPEANSGSGTSLAGPSTSEYKARNTTCEEAEPLDGRGLEALAASFPCEESPERA